ncbi:hypothetical protein, partial [Pseudonocardia sp. ICBG601]|uniref:hypothetical protein n=1 Tax=Pseudonocardia sp. ICBG601 TaxID=2846759 RepID=UPI001CF6D112
MERSEDEAAEVGVFGAALPGCPGGGDEVVVRLACLLVGWHEGVKCGSLFRVKSVMYASVSLTAIAPK